ncbi:HAD family hydrolase [Curtobacterium sp. MCPF17_001]|uniref:HAD family hydrolase n=1 Tax=Curtobacterium sp. MCPF17_001 TaxID=2175651 RepID=UPI0011B70C56|nr:HAD family hydrolase [Curtobacterium sp. MCPF17_001]
MGNERMVFWDFDGTLAVREGSWPTILREAVLAADPTQTLDVDKLAIELRGGFPQWGPQGMGAYSRASDWWAAASPVLVDACLSVGVDPALTRHAMAELPSLYYRPTAWQILPGAREALQTVSRAGLSNVVLSNHAPELPGLVDALGFGPLVMRTITSASLGVEKPDSVMFKTALHLVGAARDSWMIGDNPVADIAGARGVGMRAVLVHRSDGPVSAITLADAAAHVVAEEAAGAR